MKNQGFIRKNEAGNALIIVLLTIGLMAVMTFMLSRAKYNSTAAQSPERIKLLSSRISANAASIKDTVQRLTQISGCKDVELNFSTPDQDDYENKISPPDKHCHIFEDNGGGLGATIKNVDLQSLAATNKSKPQYGHAYVSGFSCIAGIGTDDPQGCHPNNIDLVLFVPYLRPEICASLNQANNVSIIQSNAVEDFSIKTFEGFFASTSPDRNIGDNVTTLSGKPTGCFPAKVGNDLINVFYMVLIAR